MRIKKFVSVLLVLLLFLVQAVFAAEAGSIGAGNMDIAVMTIEEPVIQVAVPTKKNLYINPLGFPVDIDGYTDNSQIIMEPAYIENQGNTSVNVSVSVTGSLVEGSTMALSSLSTKDSGSTKKRAFIYFEIQAASDPDNVTWEKEYDSTKHLVVRTLTKIRKNAVTLDAPGGINTYGVFRLTGDCVAQPQVPWTEADGLQVVVTFTFKPVVTIS